MFKDGSKKKAKATYTLIGAGSKFRGTMVTEADVRIEGEYEGSIECKGAVVVGPGGVARSSISGQEVTIAGTVYGDVHSNGKLTITASGQLHGSCRSAVLHVQPGGILNGGCGMEREDFLVSRSPAASAGPVNDAEEQLETREAADAGSPLGAGAAAAAGSPYGPGAGDGAQPSPGSGFPAPRGPSGPVGASSLAGGGGKTKQAG